MPKLSIRDLKVRGKRVLVRVDFNVPVEERDGKIVITDDTRIREALPTINWLREHGAKTILMSHFGRPKGKRADKYTLRPVADHLHTLLNQPVIFSHDTIGEVPEKIVTHMKDGDVTLLQNLRFQPGEEANDSEFAKALAKLGDLYVNDAFGAAHRAHASTAAITKFMAQSPMAGKISMLGLKQSRVLWAKSPLQKRSCGTGRSEFLRFPISPGARSRSPTRWRNRMRRQLSAVATR